MKGRARSTWQRKARSRDASIPALQRQRLSRQPLLMCSNEDVHVPALYQHVCISSGLLASPVQASCSFFSSFSLRVLFYFVLFAVNLMLLKAAGTLPPQIGAFCVFVCDRQRSERFLLLQPQQAEAALALLWFHSRGQTPTGISSWVELHLLPQAGYSYPQLFIPEANYPSSSLQS